MRYLKNIIGQTVKSQNIKINKHVLIFRHIESKFIRHLINHLKQKSEKTSELIETEAEGKSGENCLDDEEDGSPDDEKVGTKTKKIH